MVHSLQEITDAWGGWMSKQHPDGGGVRFTASTDYGAHSELDAYHGDQVATQFQSIVYQNAPQPAAGLISSMTTQFTNSTTVQQTQDYQQSSTTQQTFDWSVSQTLSVGVEISAEVPIADIAVVGAKLSTNLSLSQAQGGSVSTTQSWSVDQPLVVPAESVVTASLVITTQTYVIGWTATTLLSGQVAIWFNNQVTFNQKPHWLHFIPIETVISDCQSNNIIDTTGYALAAGGVTAQAIGTLTGSQGTSMQIKMVQTPVPGAASANVAPHVTLIPAVNKKVTAPAPKLAPAA